MARPPAGPAADNRDAVAAVGGQKGTHRVFVNEQVPDDRVAVIFGDSFGFGAEHYQGQSWFFAQVFREAHFVWIPFGWDPGYVRAVSRATSLPTPRRRRSPATRAAPTGLEVDAIRETRDGRRMALEVKLGHGQVDVAAASLTRFAERIDTARCGAPALLGVIVVTASGSLR